jgi:hypothetical protein
MWTEMVRRGDGILRLSSSETGGVLAQRADEFVATHSNIENVLRRVLVLRLATVRDDGEPARRRAGREEFSDIEWQLVSELSEFPYRLLVTVTTDAGETYAEVAHEALFRRWATLRTWIAAEREFLVWRSRFYSDRRFWEDAPKEEKDSALLMGLRLEQAKVWVARRKEDFTNADQEFINRSIARAGKGRGLAWPWTFQSTRETRVDRPSPKALGSNIFISYRRSDTRQMAGRIYDRLRDEFTAAEIFFDIDSIPPGANFRQFISGAVRASAIMLLLIGDRWRRRERMRWFGLQPHVDFVHTEIELALEFGLPILPLLVDGAEMPEERELPRSIAEVALANAILIRSGKEFRTDMEKVLDEVKKKRAEHGNFKGLQ